MNESCDHEFVNSANCLKCGIGFDALKAECLAESQANQIPDDVAAEIETVCSDGVAGKTPEHFKSRSKLFEEVDRHIRACVRNALPRVTLEFKKQLDKDLGLDALRARVKRVSDGVSEDLGGIERQVELYKGQRIEALLTRFGQDASDRVVKAFDKRVTSLVSKEVARQLARILAAAPKKEADRIRVRKKTRRAP